MAPDRGLSPGPVSLAKEPVRPDPPARPEVRKGAARTSPVLWGLLAVLCYLFRVTKGSLLPFQSVFDGRGALGLPRSTVQNLGPYSPWYALARYEPWPAECTITQVHILQRHGARFPTFDAGHKIRRAVEKLQSASLYTDERFAFLQSYKYALGFDDLTDFGRWEARESARRDYERYRPLFDGESSAYVRASCSRRVVESAEQWIREVTTASQGRAALEGPVVYDDKPWTNNTLSAHMCSKLDTSLPRQAAERWLDTTGEEIAARLNEAAPGARLVPADVPGLISLCAFDSVATSSPSPFCSLFSRAEFIAFERFADEIKYYSFGPGNPLGPVQGVGYVNELLSRLFGTTLVDETQSNHSMPFPCHRRVYADFTHDTLLVAVISALGLAPLEVSAFRASHACPFSGRLVFERASCGGASQVRALLNDKQMRTWRSLEDFRRHQSYATEMGRGDWAKCHPVSRPEEVAERYEIYETI